MNRIERIAIDHVGVDAVTRLEIRHLGFLTRVGMCLAATCCIPLMVVVFALLAMLKAGYSVILDAVIALGALWSVNFGGEDE